jgi:outer membrane protein assembly factor BamD (BamD/ComL family)
MRNSRFIVLSLLTVLALAAFQPIHAQLGFNLDVKKPAPYEDRILKAEKTGDKKLKAPKKFFQNLTTHYNYYFNANNKINEVIERAKQSHVDDYSLLLPFYNFSLDVTAQDKMQLDSVIYKSQTAIVMHDLRNDWVDNMYMLWGASFYFLQEFDSASMMFQFINHAFAEKEKDGYYKYIGSRMDGNNALSISTKEENSFLKNTFSTTPSRNDAFIWQIRSLIEKENYTYSGSLIATLKNDPLFPARLAEELEEVQAYWFYRQNIWDSSATHLIKALGQATTKQEKARWEYLAAQMFERSGKPAQAQELYARARAHTTDPIMDIYARMNMVRLNQSEDGNIDKNVEELVKMAKRSKYEDYRDVIYFMAAQMEIERKNFTAAEDYLLKASKKNTGNMANRGQIFLQIADIAYNSKKYQQAASYYDSVDVTTLKEEEATRVNDRKSGLAKVLVQEGVLDRQDSLQKIAALPEEERKNYINKLVKQLRKQQGLADDNSTLSAGRGPANTTAPPSLFDNQQSKGEWYFYNASLKTQGQATFKQTWGNRPNADNWRRFSSVSTQLNARTNNRDALPALGGTPDALKEVEEDGPSYTSLLNKLPLDGPSMQLSQDSMMNALFQLGGIFINDLEDYPSAIDALETLISRYTAFEKMDEALFLLYYAYTRMGEHQKAAQVKSRLSGYGDSRFASIVTKGKDPEEEKLNKPGATKDYEAIYDMFIEGDFEKAKSAKKIADSIYQTNYWQPQLLYIEAVYHIKEKEDSVATSVLQTLVAQNNGTPLASKAQNLIDVLQRRAEIEEELRNLQIERPAEDSMRTIVPIIAKKKPELPKETIVIPEETKPEEKVAVKPVEKAPEKIEEKIIETPPVKTEEKPIEKVPVKTEEKPVEKAPVKTEEKPVEKPIEKAPEKPVVQEPEKPMPVRADSAIKTTTSTPVVINPVQAPKDTVVSKPVTQVKKEFMFGYSFDATEQHYTLLVLDKVDAVFSGEARNAFNRYNRDKYSSRNLQMDAADLGSDKKIIIIGPFYNSQDALDYVGIAKKLAPQEIIPWLKGDKYSFLIVSGENLPVLKENKDLTLYRRFLEQFLPGKF